MVSVHGTAEEGKETLSNQVMAHSHRFGSIQLRSGKDFCSFTGESARSQYYRACDFRQEYGGASKSLRMMGEKILFTSTSPSCRRDEGEILLRDRMEKDREANKVRILDAGAERASSGNQGEAAERTNGFTDGSRAGYGRTSIRVHLAEAGHIR